VPSTVEYNTHFEGEKTFQAPCLVIASIALGMYDHSTFDNTGFAQRFLNGGSHTLTLAERQESHKTINFLVW
jgi:monoamine oxidase